jgi:tetratricopeptide (TPR) repeat protein
MPWFIILAVTGCQPVAFADKPLHEKETAAAWEAFKSEKDEEAIKHADTCILEFRGAANRRQNEIDENKEKVPNGRVTVKQKEAIHKNGALNDVATCYYIKARAAHKLGQKEEVGQAVAAAKRYPAARVWDPRGWFWSPADAAERFRTNPALADKAPYEYYTAQAWTELKSGKHAKAIALADQCTEEFLEAALDMEMDLAKQGIRLPTGEVDEPTKKKILENELLNDVATCLLIKGKAAEATGDKKAAIAAYSQAVKLAHGRCWDPLGWFWSLADAASDRLEIIR